MPLTPNYRLVESYPARLTVVIPAHNPGPALDDLVTGLFDVFAGAEISLSVIVVDDGSNPALALEPRPGLIVLAGPNQGKGAALFAGLSAARSPLLAYIDADGAYSPDQLLGLVRPLLRGPFCAAVAVRPFELSPRGLASQAFSLFVRLTHHLNYDTQAGLKVFTANLFTDVAPFLTATGFSFDVDLLSVAYRRDWSHPITLRIVPHPTNSSTLNLARVAQALKDIWRLRSSPVR